MHTIEHFEPALSATVEGDSVVDALRNAFGDGSIAHYWWQGKVCLVAYVTDTRVRFAGVRETGFEEWTIDLERVTSK